MSNIEKILVPDVGGDEVEVIEICVATGDNVEAEDAIVTVETDKASMDIPAPRAGEIKGILVNVGDKIKEGDAIAEILAKTQSDVVTGDKATVLTAKVEENIAKASPIANEVSSVKVENTTVKAHQSNANATSEIVDIVVPDIGEDGEVDVIDVLVNVGDVINEEDGLITVETDKATMDVPSSHAGTVNEVLVKVGDKVKQGSLIVKLETAAGGAPIDIQSNEDDSASNLAREDVQTNNVLQAIVAPVKKSAPVPHHPQVGDVAKEVVFASPAIRRLAREFGVDLTKVKGTGRKGRILKEDVQSYVKYELSRPKATAHSSVATGSGGLQVIERKQVDFSKFGEIETVPLTRIQKISGPNLHRNWVTIPHVTQFDEADITEVEAFRKSENQVCEKQKLGFKITPLVFIMKAVANAMAAYPVFNSSLSEDGENIIMKKYCHIGVAVDTPTGLVVPVVRDVDKKGIYQLSKELLEISAKAREGKLKAADMQGSCFTISSLGGIGGTAFTPIVNAPDVAILGVSKSEMKPKWNGSEFIPRLMLPLSLSYDHRVIDGAVAARFIVHLSSVMSDIRKLVL
jgi:pyruvate dehydrogenase E2 component (dihydrolipoamide acetyltransferase)